MMSMQIDGWIMGRLASAGPSADGTQNFSYTLERVRLELAGPMMGVTIDSASAGNGGGVRTTGGPTTTMLPPMVTGPSKGDGDEPAASAKSADRRGGGGMMGGGSPMKMMERMMPGIGALMNDGSRQVDRVLARLNGLTITFRVAPDGRIVSVDNPATLLTRIADSAGMSGPEVEQLRSIAESGVVERVATWLLESLFPVFDRGDARVADTWKAVRGEPFGLGIRSARTFRIDDAKEGVLWVGVEGDYDQTSREARMPTGGGAAAGGMTMRADVVGFEQGGYRIDLETGLPRRVTLREDVTITMSMSGGGMGGNMPGGAMMMNMRMPVTVSGKDMIQVRPIVIGASVAP
jgi:hypothetical protein